MSEEVVSFNEPLVLKVVMLTDSAVSMPTISDIFELAPSWTKYLLQIQWQCNLALPRPQLALFHCAVLLGKNVPFFD